MTTTTMTLKRARNLVKQYCGNGTPETVEAVAQRMVQHAECVWHAAHMVTGKPCWCADCKS